MIRLKNITIKNFLSVGNITQAVNFEDSGLTLVLGNNLDLGGDGSRNGVGKAQPLYSKIKTPGGWTTIGEIKVGDVVETPSGSLANVLGVYPQGNVDIYEITFEDGRKTRACGDHLWSVKSPSFENEEEYTTLTTKEIISHIEDANKNDKKACIYVPLVSPASSTKRRKYDLPFNPYLLGSLLGHLPFDENGICSDKTSREILDKYEDLSNLDKFKNLSHEERLRFLQGLFDANGNVVENGVIEFKTKNYDFALKIQYIVRSVGGIASVEKNAKTEEYCELYILKIKHPNVEYLFSNTRKKIDCIERKSRVDGLRIESVEYVGVEPAQCIMIDHKDHLYITDDFIVTHNTTLINALSYALYGQAISNIKKNNLINLTNKSGMLVTVEFECKGNVYRIERGRSPNVLRFLVNDVNAFEETNEEQGEMRLTQKEIEKVIGMNHTMFKHLVALNTYNEPFLALRANDQRDIIENLLGITLLSEKASVLKDLIKETKDKIKEEDYRIQGIKNANEQITKSINDLKRRQTVWNNQKQEKIAKIKTAIEDLEALDIEYELEQHIKLEEYKSKKAQRDSLLQRISNIEKSIDREKKLLEKSRKDLEIAKDHKCYTCGQELHDNSNLQLIESKTAAIKESKKEILKYEEELKMLKSELDSIQLDDSEPKTKYATAQEAYEQQNQLSNLKSQLDTIIESEDPYKEQIKSLEENGIKVISWDRMNELNDLKEHQEFLLKLLTNKDSFVRKKIIEQNLHYLNTRLSYYLSNLGLPHEVFFKSDLTVEITELGRELDFDNLSRGERNRLILGLSWAFRDVHESINTPIDFMAIDELIDSGLDSNGVEAALKILKKMNRDRGKNVYLISHREELIGRVNNILYVVKENGFTNFSTEKEFAID